MSSHRVVVQHLLFIVSMSCFVACAHTSRVFPKTESSSDPWQIEWARGAVFYEVFVRSFADSNGDGIGDLNGLTAKLDYLNDGDDTTTDDLGVDGIWLMPIFASNSYHGYNVTDYERIDPDYGSLEDFERFLEAAHKRGMRVIVDLVLNHTSSEHAWFKQAASSPESPFRHWYVWRKTDPGWTQAASGSPTQPVWHPWQKYFYYGYFTSMMPDLNFDHPQVRNEAKRIADIWLRRGVDGFRLDAVRHLFADGPGARQSNRPATHQYWREFAASVRSAHPKALLVGEVWDTTKTIATYYGSSNELPTGDGLPMSFNFPLSAAILHAVLHADSQAIAAAISAKQRFYPPQGLDGTFVTNHDMVRIATQLNNDNGKMRAVTALLLTLPGTPFLYYGEEIGLRNGPFEEGDPAKRTPMPWQAGPTGGFSSGAPWRQFAPERAITNVETQTNNPKSLLSYYRKLIRLRHTYPALRLGTTRLLETTPSNRSLLAFLREHNGQRVLVIHNLSGKPATAGHYPISTKSGDLLFGEPTSLRHTENHISAVVAPYSVIVLRIK